MDLFPLEESLSPRLKWMRDLEMVCEPPSDSFSEWSCYSMDDQRFPLEDHQLCGYGPDEESALIDFAMKNDLPTWH